MEVGPIPIPVRLPTLFMLFIQHLHFVLSIIIIFVTFSLSYFLEYKLSFSSYHLHFSEHSTVYLVAFSKFIDYLIKLLILCVYEDILGLIISNPVVLKNDQLRKIARAS